MCGIVAVVRRRTSRELPDSGTLLAEIVVAAEALPPTDKPALLSAGLEAVAAKLAAVDHQLRGEAGLRAMLADATLPKAIRAHLTDIGAHLLVIESYLDANGSELADLEAVNGSLTAAKDVVWSIERDRLRAAKEVRELASATPGPAELAALLSIYQALSNLDRLEVRGRDSAGLHVLVRGHGLNLDDPRVAPLVEKRAQSPLFGDRALRTPDGLLSFVYKAAAEIGELGDNTASMRKAIVADELLHLALTAATAEATVLAHTRWASVGIISEANAHPVNSDEVEKSGEPCPYVCGVLNGDVDNFADLIAAEGLKIATEITTDAKVIPTMVSRGLVAGHDLNEAVRSTVSQFEGSVAIGLSSSSRPKDLHLALRGSGQGVFVGLAEDAFVVASEPYGVVEDCDLYLRMDGETPADASNPSASQGQILQLDGADAGQPEGVSRAAYDGTPLPISAQEWKAPAVTTSDIDRGLAPHFLLKEISESPKSFRKTLRGRLVEADTELEVQLTSESFPVELKTAMGKGRFTRIDVIGQGTAAIAGQAVAEAIRRAVDGAAVHVRAITATELSGFNLRADMSDTMVVAISQSGTTTDTNRTVDLVRNRGAAVLAIVNRRGSDLVDKSDGVLYTSDGRDVEMSVASTKAFYSQIAAGFLLADQFGELLADTSDKVYQSERQAVLRSLRDLPEAMEATLAKRPDIASAASRHALSRRYWAMVGNGPNAVAAKELRVKLSELCYKAIACDITEDKKHIDLSSEPMILVCAAGLSGSNADDVAKEVAIFRAHKAAPIAIATEGENRFSSALDVITVPPVHPQLAFVLSTVVGHLFGYEAALAIDSSALCLREARGVIERFVGHTEEGWFETFGTELQSFAAKFFGDLRAGQYNGHLEASTATRLSAHFRYALGMAPFEGYQVEFGKVGTPGVIVEDLALALTAGIEELTRPIDAIKHQAKTVTVGISRADESLLQADVIQAVLETGCPRDRLSYRSLRTLAALDRAVSEVVGYTRYQIEGDLDVEAQLHVVDKGGVATGIASRIDRDPTLRGTKHRVAVERDVFVSVGSDGRVVMIVPEVKDTVTAGLTLCHIKTVDRLGAAGARTVLQGYRNRYRQLVDVVTERQPTFRDDLLAEVETVELLTAPISDVAALWAED